jgi:hypothetical protein
MGTTSGVPETGSVTTWLRSPVRATPITPGGRTGHLAFT